MARYMVSECGMNDVVGPMYVSEGDSRHNVLSETVKERIDAQVCVGVRAGVGVGGSIRQQLSPQRAEWMLIQ